MNHFFALQLPHDVRQQIAEHSVMWRGLLGPDFPARWYEPEDYHITIKFLGDIDASRQDELIAAVTPLTNTTSPFDIQMASPGVLPNERFVNVLIRYLRSGEEMLLLRQRLEVAMQEHGFPAEGRRFTPHITVARCNKRPQQEVPILSLTTEQVFAFFRVVHLVLMQTTPHDARQKDRPIRYNTVHLFPLGTPPSSAG